MTFTAGNVGWVKHSGTSAIWAFDDADSEAWENVNSYAMRWIYDPDAPSGERYRVFYSAGDSYADNDYSIGLMTGSTLAGATRVTASNPVITPALFTEITAVSCQELCVWIKDGAAGTYGGLISVEVAGSLINIWEVESANRGVTWSVVGTTPLIDRGHTNADDNWACKPSIAIQSNGDHWIYYTGAYGSGTTTNICLAKRTGGTGAATKITGVGSATGKMWQASGFYSLYPCPVIVDGITYLFFQQGVNGSPAGPYEIRLLASDDGETNWQEAGTQLPIDIRDVGPADWYIGTPWIAQDENGVWRMTYSCRKHSEIGTTRYNRHGLAELITIPGGSGGNV